jgi:hypothetical protein
MMLVNLATFTWIMKVFLLDHVRGRREPAGLLLFGLSNLACDGWGNVRAVSDLILAAVVLLAIFIPFELRWQQPLLNLWLYCHQRPAAADHPIREQAGQGRRQPAGT